MYWVSSYYVKIWINLEGRGEKNMHSRKENYSYSTLVSNLFIFLHWSASFIIFFHIKDNLIIKVQGGKHKTHSWLNCISLTVLFSFVLLATLTERSPELWSNLWTWRDDNRGQATAQEEEKTRQAVVKTTEIYQSGIIKCK